MVENRAVTEPTEDPKARPRQQPGDTRFFDQTYGASPDELTRIIREAAFGEDLGQFSWTTAPEYRRFLDLLGIDATSAVLDVACGSGGPALFMARTTGCRVAGVDIHEAGIEAANGGAAQQGIADRATFRVHDAREPFPFEHGAFDAIISIDSINHLFGRGPVFAEWQRMLRPGGRLLYTDAVVVTGPLLRDEVIARSPSMGAFVFTPEGHDLPLLRAAGFVDIEVEDVTDNIVGVTGRWHEARERLARQLDEVEGPEANVAFQEFLAATHRLASERRLSRFAYRARKDT
jgi:SAM-dependent methyltransferase